jgi:hypothetical protein
MPGGGYYIALAIFGIIGGGIALVYKEVVTHKAFLLGVGAPALIVAGGNVADQRVSLTGIFSIVPSAIAQEVETSNKPSPSDGAWTQHLTDGKLVVVPIEPRKFGGKYVESDVHLMFRSTTESGTAQLYDAAELKAQYQIETEIPNNPNFKYAIIPNNTTSTLLSGKVVTFDQKGARDIWEVETNEVQIPPNEESLKLNFEKKQTFWGGFYDAFGMDSFAKKQTQYPAVIEPFKEDLRN